MSSNMRKTIVTVCVIFIIVLLVAMALVNPKVVKNDPYTVGNTASNINNKGLFCEYEGRVYFANPNDNCALYSMNPDETDFKKISSVAVQSINVDKNRIYYSMSGASSGSGLGYIRKATGLYSIKKNGTSAICYTQDPVVLASLCGNKLYYQHYRKNSGTDLDCVDIDKNNNHTVVENMVSPASVDSGYIYYAGAGSDMYLYRLDSMSDASTPVYEHNMYNPVYKDGYIYYMDMETNYHLNRYNPASGEDITLTTDRVDTFNVVGNMIYYQYDSSSPDAALKRMTTDGMDNEVVAAGIYCDINATSYYVYFHPYDSYTPTYRTPIYGSVMVYPFEAPVID